MTETETDLIEGLRKQNPHAQQQMLDQYGRDVYAQVVRLVPIQENAEEVYQDVFIKVFTQIGKYDAEKSSLRTWISRIAYNESISFLRRKAMPVIYASCTFYAILSVWTRSSCSTMPNKALSGMPIG
jgi:RNA polymerase sigma-70 factor (ECF subfamily)